MKNRKIRKIWGKTWENWVENRGVFRWKMETEKLGAVVLLGGCGGVGTNVRKFMWDIEKDGENKWKKKPE